MANFRDFAEKLNAIALDAREQITKAENNVKTEKEIRSSYPELANSTAEYRARRASAEASYQIAVAKHDDLLRVLPELVERQVMEIRKELSAAVDDAFAANPAALDMPVLELLKSGILRPAEYQRLLNSAVSDKNYTMVRMIGASAAKASEETAAKYGQGDEITKAFRSVSNYAQRVNGEVYLNNFDVLRDVLHRCLRNSSLWPKWESLTDEVIAGGFKS